jgi:hypothetical protein
VLVVDYCVIAKFSFSDVDVVSKVEIGLPTAAMVLDVISKSRSFNKWMILFTCHE